MPLFALPPILALLHGPLPLRTWGPPALQLLGAALVALALFLGHRARVRQLRHRNRDLEALLRLAGDLSREVQEANRKLQEQSLTDPLTGLRNRRYLEAVLEVDLRMAERHQRLQEIGRPLPNPDLIFLMVDVDHFKAVNDTHGHPVGDEVLRTMGRILLGATRGTDTVARWGGEEFLVVARHTRREEAMVLAERIRSAVAAAAFPARAGTTLGLTCSVGFAPHLTGDWPLAVDLADQCLYRAKASGRNRWVGLCPLEGIQPAGEEAGLALEPLLETGRYQLLASPRTQSRAPDGALADR